MPLVKNHFLMGWMYTVLSTQAVSIIIGISEIIVSIGLIASLKWHKIGKYAGLGSVFIFLTTLSFLLTTPGVWRDR